MKNLIWVLVFVLFLAHQDIWFWDSEGLVFGFMPVGLFYHALYSIAAAALWAAAIKFAWPDHLERLAEDQSEETADSAPAKA